MNKEIKFEVIKDKVFKKEVDNLIRLVDTVLLRRHKYLKDLKIDVAEANEVRKTLKEMKEISTKNTYANKIITEIETQAVKAEKHLNDYLIQGVRYERFYNQIENAYKENHDGYRTYDVDFFENIINFAAINQMTSPLTEDEELVRAEVKRIKELDDTGFKGDYHAEIKKAVSEKAKKLRSKKGSDVVEEQKTNIS